MYLHTPINRQLHGKNKQIDVFSHLATLGCWSRKRGRSRRRRHEAALEIGGGSGTFVLLLLLQRRLIPLIVHTHSYK
jgi:hypothetical protein